MAGCAARWCKYCNWLCLDTPSLRAHAEHCSKVHDVGEDRDAATASAGGTALFELAAAAPAPAPAPAPVQPVSMAQRYREALLKANLPLGHVFDFGHARQFVFVPNVERDGRRGTRTARAAGETSGRDGCLRHSCTRCGPLRRAQWAVCCGLWLLASSAQ